MNSYEMRWEGVFKEINIIHFSSLSTFCFVTLREGKKVDYFYLGVKWNFFCALNIKNGDDSSSLSYSLSVVQVIRRKTSRKGGNLFYDLGKEVRRKISMSFFWCWTLFRAERLRSLREKYRRGNLTHLKRRGKKVISGVETLSVMKNKGIKDVHEVSKSLIKINGKYLYHELTQKTS